METHKNLGIWMDHVAADLIDISSGTNDHIIVSDFTFEHKDEALNKSEKTMHNKQRQMQEQYYKKIADVVLKYQHILLFGPTDAKIELHNYLKSDVLFKDIKMDVKETDKMTDPEKEAYVKNHFK
ncbi:hypothetical protein [Flavobacterium sp. TAB 87]|uniref:hypothetical protein n=1 Tax=Flavobacterium sp. TAB 87 TaxID=1729581 RepID=UPI00076CAC52|nr:hypothetical protein [Flavobacterium sp. TAB 87]KVV14796.1 hypothetical protein AP058_01852 [Flavobacterium sp. TAB 87]